MRRKPFRQSEKSNCKLCLTRTFCNSDTFPNSLCGNRIAMRRVVAFTLMLVASASLGGCRCVPTYQEPQGYSSTYHKALRRFEMHHQAEMMATPMTSYPSAPMGTPCPPMPPLPMSVPAPAPAPAP
jgi:hypothetical protein